MKKLSFLFILPILCCYLQLGAQTAVYYCSETGYYGYCYGTSDVGNCAYNNCLREGGRSPRLIGSIVNQKGYGAIALGRNANGIQTIGAAAGQSTQEKADQMARNFCAQYGGKSPYIDARFYDGK